MPGTRRAFNVPLLLVCNLLSCCLPMVSVFSCLGSSSVVLEVLLVGLKYFDVNPPHDQRSISHTQQDLF